MGGKVTHRRFIGASRAKMNNVVNGWLTYNPMTDATTEWVIVPDDDPRAETVIVVETSK